MTNQIMKKIISFTICLFCLMPLVKAQVYLNVEEAAQSNSADLQVDSDNTGVVFPHVFLNATNDYLPVIDSPQPGLLVYNPNLTNEIDPGYYYWAETPAPAHWEKLGGMNEKGTIIQNVDIEFMGYDPTGIGANSPNSIAIGGKTATKQRCSQWEINEGGNGHVYCAYTVNSTINFGEAFTASQSNGGYVLTVVSDAEWNFVKDNIINDGLGIGGAVLTDNIWLGYVKLSTPGNGYKYFWLTHETWENNWSNNSTTQSYFVSGQPEEWNANNATRCTFIQRTVANPDRLWSSQTCSTTTNMTNLIIEFNQ